MENFEHERAIIITLLTDLAEAIGTDATVETVIVADRERDHYQLLHLGWQGERRIFDTAVYLRLHAGKIWIEHNALPDRVGELLVEAGIPREQIVLGFQPPQWRSLTDFAAA
jgi:hypothetical protein